ncbi:hypothetical protein OAE29_05625 [Octadecabacter sp.]|nr:hypothetical protein [Octadecabacter sp.]
MGVFQNNLMGAAAAAASAGGGGFYDHQIANSVRFTGSGRLTRTAGTPTNIDKFTISFWVKRSDVTAQNNLVFGDTDNINYQMLRFSSTEKLELHEQRGGGDSNGLRTVDQVFRDPSAWMHVVWVYDSGNSTEADREIFYVNGTRLTDVEGWDGGYPAQNRDSVFNQSGATQVIGGASAYYGNHLDGYMAEVVFNDGQAYAASNYGETKNGVWIPKDPSGLTFGDNGFYLNFASSGDLGNDVSGNNNDFALTNIAAHDQMLDSPTFNSSSNGGNFATLGPLWNTPDMTFSEGNLKWTTSTNQRGVMSNWSIPLEGKYYFEYVPLSWGASSGDDQWIGVNVSTVDFTASRGGKATCYGYGANSGKKIDGDGTEDSYGAAWATNDIIGVAVDRVNDTIQFSKNGSFQGSAFAISATADLFPWLGSGGGTSSASGVFNFGQDGTFAGNVTAGGNSDDTGYGNFKYDPPTGFLAMCSGNLPTADAVDPAQTDDNYPQKLFGATIWTGNAATGRAITGLGFQPDWLWFKSRGSAFSHRLYDTSRGIASNGGKRLFSNTDGTETDQTSGQDISAVGSDGFTLGASSNLYTNDTNDGGLHVNWAWRANGGTTSSNGNGSITSTVQVDPSGCFSIVTYTGESATRTVGHGLSAAPYMMIIKSRGSSYNWGVYHTDIGLNMLKLNSYVAQDTGASSVWGNAHPTSSVFSIGDASETGKSVDYIAYCFANCDGYIKAGSYVGNGSTDGAFVYTGLKPAWVMTKMTDGGAEWTIFDTKRDPHNLSEHILQADLADAERTDLDEIDILSNGFKCKYNGGRTNQSGKTYIYLAFASNPFQYATAR